MSSPPQEQHPPLTLADRQEADVIKIMLATDNHIGYMERDPVRGQDTINTFKEILELAVKHEVDFILLGGDLFHENRPSRDCLYRTSALLREYTMNDKPIQVELLSDPDEGKAEGCSFPAINYEDPNLNVGIPVFSIHGNHDDPQGAGPEGALCALDLLSVTGLINYVGKLDLSSNKTPGGHAENTTGEEGGIKIKPVLLRKGHTQLAMYPIGNVKDQRLHFELRSNRVRMYMPRDKEDWFNILIVHQNRVKHGPQEYVPEGMFDDSINLVVWGHEHDCRIEPEEVAGKPYFITQPGSSVATSLSEGESIPKKVALLEVAGREFQMTPIPLRTVRPFVTEEVILSEVAEEENLLLSDKLAIQSFLRKRVEALIERAKTEFDQRNEDAIAEGEEPLPPMLPLVRLKVDTTGVHEMSNPVRFGQEFLGKVANPKDLLVFSRAKKSAAKSVKMDAVTLGGDIDDKSLPIHERLAKVRVAHLVEDYLGAQELQLLGENGLSEAVQMFVDKDDPASIKTYITKSTKTIFSDVSTKEMNEDDLEEALAKAKEVADDEYKEKADKRAATRAKSKAKEPESEAEERDSLDEDIPPPTKSSRSTRRSDDYDEEEEEEEEPVRKTAKKKAPAKAAAPKKASAPKKAAATKKTAASKKKTLFNSDEDEDDDHEVIQIDVDEDEEEEEEEAPKPKKGRAAVLSQIAKKPPPKKRAAATSSSAKQSTLIFGGSSGARGTSSRAASKAAKNKMQDDIIAISDDD